MTRYFRHIKHLFTKIKVEVTIENKRKLDGFLGIFRAGLCVFEQPTGYEGRSVAIGDYDNDALGGIASEATAGSEGINSHISGVMIATIPVKKQE